MVEIKKKIILGFLLLALGMKSYSQDMRYINQDEYHQIVGNINSYVAFDYFNNDTLYKDLHLFLNFILPNPSDDEYLSFYVVPYDTMVTTAGDTLHIFEFNFDGYVIQPIKGDIKYLPLGYFHNKPCKRALIAKSKRLERLYFISGYFFLDNSEFLFKSSTVEWTSSSASDYVRYRYHNWSPEIISANKDRLVFYSEFYKKSYEVYFDSINTPRAVASSR
ncbi:hypothetical protein Oweho_0639 [Owenweeksia hongkongensis DSM 17368]|uniref:Uncharacterized protein n=1 Tax=Owenweeksia hongkongensis (strain DSM 17368 / CIP 108786 / JCM 12287 / NRRL B-23963 / UST20020801) TaxID=926562 RepID=G8R0Y2_OWEHD|nr:hypothetical protein [Owenweeksia hongkongensis]AEV31653.1 hypothetical protein Oweho_0639 [Owenweeksia hongkongensis DSM 17368]